jgi:hypothetical protein
VHSGCLLETMTPNRGMISQEVADAISSSCHSSGHNGDAETREICISTFDASPPGIGRRGGYLIV